jgi:hypothetical protein
VPQVKECTTSTGEKRYRYVIDLGKKRNGQRRQATRTFRTREAAEEHLAQEVRAVEQWRRPTGQLRVADLFGADACHPMCVFAIGAEEDNCECVCGGRFHGRLVDLRCDWAYIDLPLRPKPKRLRRAPISPEFRARVLELRAEALTIPVYRWRPATYVRERLTAEGFKVTQRQVNSWIEQVRKAEGQVRSNGHRQAM